jgi:iron complex outermembrane receptor protein
LLSTKPLFAEANGKVNNKTQARRPAFFLNEYRTFGKKSSEIMTTNKLFLFSFLLLSQIICAQKDTIALEEVTIADAQLKKFSSTQSVLKLKDSIISKNQPSLTALLNNNTTIYFKENGLGMVSSPSFRGTTAQQTAVIWNGININSQLLGQTDFNTITTQDFNSIVVRAGGGSAIYGTSAIGGSIHLNNELDFKKTFSNELNLRYGSFNTFGANYKLVAANAVWSSQLSLSRYSSNNDYPYLGTDKKNENGEFENTSYNLNVGYKINAKNTLKLYSQLFSGQRHFSGTLTAPSRSKYLDLNSRNLVEWDAFYGSFLSKVKAAYLTENYNYYEDKNETFFSQGKAETAILKHDLSYHLNAKINFNSILEYAQTVGSGSSLLSKKRQVTSAVLLMKHQLREKVSYELSIRKEITSTYNSPFLYSFGTKYDATENYTVKINVSRNFRIPSFNDLYWQQGGNPNLRPENAYQYEVGQELKFNDIRFNVTGFLNKIEDLISWKPNASGLWQPENTKNVTTYGVEAGFIFDKKIGNQYILCNANYAYTVSENDATGLQLIYVPYHKLSSSVSYSYKRISSFCQFIYNGEVFTSSDNFYTLKSNATTNLGVNYELGTKKNIKVGFQLLNLFNEKYQSVASRPMPGRNYSINLIFKLY